MLLLVVRSDDDDDVDETPSLFSILLLLLFLQKILAFLFIAVRSMIVGLRNRVHPMRDGDGGGGVGAVS